MALKVPSRGKSFVVMSGCHIHTCDVPTQHPLYTDAAHCGACEIYGPPVKDTLAYQGINVAGAYGQRRSDGFR